MPRMKQIAIDVDVNGAVEANRSSFSETHNDILRKMLLKNPVEMIAREQQRQTANRPPQRVRGEWFVEIDGAYTSESSLKGAYCSVLRQLEARNPGFIQNFSMQKSRSRRFVAKIPTDLYDNSKHLASDHAFEILPGWYVDTNLSEQQVAQRVELAAQLVGLTFRAGLVIKEGARQI